MTYFLGIDVSTTATKALLIDARGAVAAEAASEYGYESPFPLWSEQRPELWWDAAVESIRRLLAGSGADPAAIRGIGLTGQMHGLVILDAKGEPLRPAILWNDQRSGAECDEIRKKVGKRKFIRVTGNDALPGFTAPKLLWVRNHEPQVYAAIRKVLLPKDYLRFRLTGEYAIDRAGGAGTVLFDLANRTWSDEIVRKLGIDPDWLPPTFEGTEVTGVVSAAAAEATGLAAGTPVFGGGGDQAAGAVGAGAVEEGIVSLSLGTSGVVFAAVDRPVVEREGRLHAFCHALPGKWHLMGVMLSAAGSLRWFRDTVAPGEEFADLVETAGQAPAGSEGLFFLPYLTGERTPHPDPLARGAFAGLTVRHTRSHLTRAVLEGVAFGLRDCFELVRGSVEARVTQVRVSGGGTRSPVWRRIIADVLGADLVTVNTTEGAAYGAALLAAAGAGAFESVEAACREVISISGSTPPGPDREVYDALYPLYRKLYPALKPVFHG